MLWYEPCCLGLDLSEYAQCSITPIRSSAIAHNSTPTVTVSPSLSSSVTITMSPTDSSSGNRGVPRGLILTAVTIASVGVVLFVVMGVILVSFKKYRYTQKHPEQQRDNCGGAGATVMDDDNIIYSSPVSNNSETNQDEADMTMECEVYVYSSVYSEICETYCGAALSSSVEEPHVGNVFQSIF